MPDFLSKGTVDLPVGGAPSGFVGQWLAVVRYKFMTEENPAGFSDVPTPDSFRVLGDWFHCYYVDYNVALTAHKALGLEYTPSQVWYFEAPIDTVMLPDDTKANFGAAVSMECAVKTLRSGKYRHEFHFLALPAAVAAYALMKGYINYEFDVDVLTDRELVVDDEFSSKYIGGEYFDLEEQENITIPYTESILWKQREQLWADLGEPDARVYNQKGSGKRYSTTSDRLSECLGICAQPWKSPIWARVAMVQDPRVDAVAGSSGNRLTRPALLHIYETEEEAREESGSSGETTETTSTSPPLPSMWVGIESEWVDTLRSLKAELGTPPIPLARAKLVQLEADGELEGRIAATAEEALAWWSRI